MVLNLPGYESVFEKRRKDPTETLTKRAGEIIVALDGSGDTDSLLEAINQVESGGVILIKEGTYILTSAVTISKSNIVIKGSGFSTIIKNTARGNLLTATSKNNLVFDNLKFWNDWTFSGQTNACIDMTSCTDSRIINCFFLFGEIAIKLTTCTNIVINNCNCDGNASANSVVYLSGSNYCFIYGNYLSSVNDYFCYLTGSSNHNNFFDNEGGAGTTMFYITGSSYNAIIGNIAAEGAAWGEELTMAGDSNLNIINANIFPNDGINITAATCDKNIVTSNIATITNSGTGTIVANNTI